jgi:hypothetical protein
MSKIEVNQIDVQCGSTLTVGSSGKTVSLAPGASQTGFGRTGTVDWCTTAKTSPFAAVSGDGFFVNTTCGGVTVTLPSSPSQGDIVAFKDYAGTFDCSAKALTVCRNGSKINGNCANTTLSTQGQSVTLIYVDGTKGWQDIHDSSSDITGQDYISATGGSVSNSPCGDFKLHKFTGDSTFVVSNAGNAFGSNTIEYLVVAGGGGGGADGGAGGGAGGVRSNFPSPASGGIPVTAPATYPVTVGGGGAGATEPGKGTTGCNSSFAGTTTITSAGGGGGGGAPNTGLGGGSGGGGRKGPGNSGGAGNDPPVSPPQGEPGGTGAVPGTPPAYANTSGGGGGACNAGQNAPASPGPSAQQFSLGGDGRPFPVAAFGANGDTQPGGQFFGGGGGSGQGSSSGSGNTPYCTPLGNGGKGGGGPGGDSPSPGSPQPQVFGRAGTANTGGGGGGAAEQCASGPPARNGGAGGGGIVIIRYKFQN